MENISLLKDLCKSNEVIEDLRIRNKLLRDRVKSLEKSISCSNSFTTYSRNVDESKDGNCLSYPCLVVHTGDKTLFKHLKERKDDFVTFGNGSRSQVLGKGSVEIPGLPIKKEVVYIDGLKANLLSISQLCDDDYLVQFSMKKCLVFNEDGIQVICGRRTSDNCYGIVPNSKLSCRSARVDLMELWHQRFGRANHKQLSKISKLEAVIRLLKFGKFQKTICGLGQMGNKQGILISK